jgi:hypothetical protein
MVNYLLINETIFTELPLIVRRNNTQHRVYHYLTNIKSFQIKTIIIIPCLSDLSYGLAHLKY